MRTERVEFYSGLGPAAGLVRGYWHTPDTGGGRLPAIVQGPGWFGLATAKGYRRYHEGLTAAGFGILVIDYRGFGDSEGERGLLSPAMQLEDLVSAVTYLTTRDDVGHETIGAYATGGTGGGNVVLLADADPRVRAVVSQVPVADGRDWLHRMRTEHEWLAFLAGLEQDRKERVSKGTGRLVNPHDELMVQTPERRSVGFKSDVDREVPPAVPLAIAEPLLSYRPAEAAARLATPLLVIAVDGDATTPTDHATAIYEAARGPKKLLLQRNSGHYTAYAQYADIVISEMVAWFRRYLVPPDDVVISAAGE